ncbi:30S ribosomal protein S15 [Lyticum sinuosum]|uniref:Small ribosomal subunit protein uS15 n=1 Tax=Lyticum sinuosum TaxID=1332059 RepID=A0AAE4VM08_9RICK|nr:30S ribosomal protein S15 [Lyticum sinuosum]MDZ5761173.1 30S ribosomal protein S15 [Lyticum sinuosum]
MTNLNKKDIIQKFQRDHNDTGSTEVQCAVLTARIEEISNHCFVYKKDHQSRRGLIMLVAKRKKLLKYLNRTNKEKYIELMNKLGLKIKN